MTREQTPVADHRAPRTAGSGQRAAGSGQRRTARIRCSARKRLIRFYFVAFAVLILSQLQNAIRSGELLYSRAKHELRCSQGDGRKKSPLAGGHDMELKISSSRSPRPARPVNECAQCRETIFLPEWSEYLDARRVRHLWECEACGYKFETLVCFPEL
jgi:hypothetical protein